VQVLAASATTLVAILVRWGYTFGYFDQTVLSLRGIALADPHAFRSDWFTQSVPQPHWFFDIVTYLGERVGLLPWVYLAYWLAGIVAFGTGAVWLAERFLPGRRAAAALMGPLAALAPQAVLGSSGPLVWFAIPNMLGGCLAFLALAALLTGRFRIAVLGALVAGVVHVQHGANLAAVLMLAAAMPGGWSRRQRFTLFGVAVTLLAGAEGVAVWRHIQPNGPEWLQACRELIPYHCYAPSWRLPYLMSGTLIVAMAGVFAWLARDRIREVVPAVVLPVAALVVGVTAERYGWGALGRLAQIYNVHRFATLVVPFGAVGVLVLGDRIGRNHSSRWRRTALGALAGAFVFVWSSTTENPYSHRLIDRPSLLALALAVAVAVWVARWGNPAEGGRSRLSLRPPVAVALVAALLPGVISGAAQGAFGRVGIETDIGGIRAAVAIGRAVPDTAVIAAPPEIYWLRLLSRRAVVADCKAGPYGGEAWHEYMRRLDALGGCDGEPSHFADLTADQIEALRGRYGVTHVLLYGNDPKIGYARAHWSLVFEAPPENSLHLQHGWALFDMEQP